MKMWAGRFEKELNEAIHSFNSSISFDFVMYNEDITASLAHANMLCACGIISSSDKDAICGGLLEILSDIKAEKLLPNLKAEDIHMFVEEELTRRIGDAGKRLHTARSRNDQVACDLRLYLHKKIGEIKAEVKELAKTIVQFAKSNTKTVMPGYTHMQIAQPITFAHQIMAYAQMLKRDYARLSNCDELMLENPLGACALAGTSYPINRALTTKELGFNAPCQNSIDAVSDRDFCVELASCISLIMVHLSRFSEEIIIWNTSEFAFIELDDAFATGSSIMPQKKNPDITELIRGKSGRVFGNLQGLLTMLKGLPLAYNKDMQEDKEAIFDAVDTVLACLTAFRPMLASMQINAGKMKAAAEKGFINATDCADYLTKKGVPFRDAYKTTGALVNLCIKKNCTLNTLKLEDYKAANSLFEEDIYTAIALDTGVSQRTSLGGGAPVAVTKQIENYEDILNNLK
jgi:argininosuccinate lyase